MSARNTVVLKGEIERRYDEGVVGSGITAGELLPGYLIEQDGNGEYVPHTDTAAVGEILVAVEDDFRGMTIEGDLPSDGVVAGGTGVGYITGDKVRFHIAQKGDVLQMVLHTGETADEDDFLTSNGDGTLKTVTSTNARMFRAMEAMTASGNTLIKVRVV